MVKLLVCLIIFSFGWSALASPYVIELLHFSISQETDKDNFVDPGTLRIAQIERNVFVISGTAFVKYNFGKKDAVKLQYQKKLANDKYLLLFSGITNTCALAQEPFYKTITEHSNMPYPPPCPFPKGNYTMNGLRVDETFYPKVLPTGENLIVVEYMVDNVVVFGVKIATNIKRA